MNCPMSVPYANTSLGRLWASCTRRATPNPQPALPAAHDTRRAQDREVLRDVVQALAKRLGERSHRHLVLALEEIDKPYPQWLAQYPQPLSYRLRRLAANRAVEAVVLAGSCGIRSLRLGSCVTHELAILRPSTPRRSRSV